MAQPQVDPNHRAKRCSESVARAFVAALVGDPEWVTPHKKRPGYELFAGKDLYTAHALYEELYWGDATTDYELEVSRRRQEGRRMREMMRLLGDPEGEEAASG